MSTKRVLKALVLAVVLVSFTARFARAHFRDAGSLSNAVDEPDVYEVAEDATRFVIDILNAHDDGMPAYGNPFITQGYIYPEGTLNGTNGVLPSGEPEFPEQVLGEWTCYGWFIGEGAYTESGEAVVSTQVFKLYGEDGDSTLVSNGFELSTPGVEVTRVLAGGTGEYGNVRGVQIQELMGMTEQMGVNLRVSFELDS